MSTPSPPAPYRALVKSALSGVSVVLRGRPLPGGQPPKERTLYLAHLVAPKMGNRDRADEAYAFDSREALRLLCVGREVQFTMSYTIPAANGPALEFGELYLPGRDNLDVAREMVSTGWAKVKESRRDEDEAVGERKAELRKVEDEARLAGRGLWAAERAPARTINYSPPQDLQAFLGEWKGKPLDAIVESTSNGSTIRVRLLLRPNLHQFANIQFAGCRAPRASSVNPPPSTSPEGHEAGNTGEDFGDEAKFFTESRLLQRNVSVTLVGLPPPPTNPNTALIAIVAHPAGSIASLLLASGFARCQDLHAGLLGADAMGALRKSEADARMAQRGLWKAIVAKKGPATNGVNGHGPNSGKAYEAVVVRVWGGDTLSVRKGRNGEGEEVRLQLSSIRQPKLSDPKLAGLQAEGRELLRKRIIGKVVNVLVDYRKPAEGNYEAKDCATVTHNGVNVALALVERGLVNVIRHRRDDDDKSSDLDRLMQAEVKAAAEGKGLHSGKDFPAPRVPDASETLAKATSFLAGLKRNGRIPAVVDFVMSGSRFKVVLPKQDIKLTLVLSGIRAPRTARNPNEKSEPYGQEAYEFAVRRTLQRDVEISVQDVDRSGGFIGALYLGKGENYATMMVRDGLASVNEYSASQSSFGKELMDAETEAKADRKHLWSTFDSAVEEAKQAAAAEAAAPPAARREYVDILLSDVRPDPFSFSVQILHDGGIAELSQLMADFALHHQQASSPPGWQPKVGELVSARFTEDAQWYRAKVKKVAAGKRSADVIFHDYGNSETLPFDALRPLPEDFRKLPGQAHEAVLSFVKLPGYITDYGAEAVDRFRSLTEGRPLVANIDYREAGADGRMHLTLYDPADPSSRDEAKSINATLVREGLAFLDRKCRYLAAYPQAVTTLKAAHQEARRDHAGALQYGDIEDDDE